MRDRFVEVKLSLRASTRKDPTVFRFDATRFIGQLQSLNDDDQPLFRVKFEVQIRTAFEHAWSVTTHALAYKGSGGGWRHKRLASQLRAAVEQLDQVVQGFEEWADIIQEQFWQEAHDHKRIIDFMRQAVADGLLPKESVPDSWMRFSENLRVMIFADYPGAANSPSSERVSKSFKALSEEMQSLGKGRFPMSLSLLQFCLGALCKRKIFSRALNGRYVAPVTEELLGFYPEVQEYAAKAFQFDG